MNNKKLLRRVFVLILITTLLTGCGPGQVFGPTVTPTSTSTLVPPTATPRVFSLFGDAFEASYKDECDTDATLNSVKGSTFNIGGTISLRGGEQELWCYGAKHTWIGTLTYVGYVFKSDKNEPLQFVVTVDGYKYVSGKGAVTSPDGSVTMLPSEKAPVSTPSTVADSDCASTSDCPVSFDLIGIWKSDNVHAPDNSWKYSYSMYFQFTNTKQYVYNDEGRFNSNRPTEESDIVYLNLNDSTFIKKFINIPDQPELLGKFQKWTWRFDNGNVLFTIYGFMDSQDIALNDGAIIALATGVKAQQSQTETQAPIDAPTLVPVLINWNEIPIMPEAITGQEDMGDYQFTTKASTEEIKTYYKSEMINIKWELRQDMMDSIPTDLAFKKGDTFVFFKINPENNNNVVWIHIVKQ